MTTTAEGLQELPAGFVPGDHDVVIGKGKKFYFHTGNQWLRTLVSSMLDEYKQAQTKSDKSNIISDVVEYVRQNGRFVKRDLKTGKWVYAEPLLCREKCSQTFRDNLAETYRSSNVAKRNKRRAEQQEKKRLPDNKRMRLAPTGAAPSGNVMLPGAAVVGGGLPPLQPQQQPQATAPAPIPSNLFDLEMPLWSPAKDRNLSLLPGNLDFSALTRPSITGATTTTTNNQVDASNNALNLNNLNLSSLTGGGGNGNNGGTNNTQNGSFQLSGLSSMNLMQNLPDILSNLTASIANANNNNAAPAPTPATTGEENPFEPTPLAAATLPPLTGTVEPALGSGLCEPNPMPPLFGGGEPAQKRHSLAMISDTDWFKALTAAVPAGAPAAPAPMTPATPQDADGAMASDLGPKISAAFAA